METDTGDEVVHWIILALLWMLPAVNRSQAHDLQ
jgi:hypothetical protein